MAFARKPQIIVLVCIVCGEQIETSAEDKAGARAEVRRASWSCRLLGNEWACFCARCK